MTASLLERLADLPKTEVDALIRAMAPREANAFEYHWRYRARPEQLPPEGSTYSADEPERLRGPQHDAAWCDELGAWRYPEAWDMLMFGMRLGADPPW